MKLKSILITALIMASSSAFAGVILEDDKIIGEVSLLNDKDVARKQADLIEVLIRRCQRRGGVSDVMTVNKEQVLSPVPEIFEYSISAKIYCK